LTQAVKPERDARRKDDERAGAPDPARDGADYQVGAMWLNDAELAELKRDLAAVARPRLGNAPGSGRTRRMMYAVMLPAPETRPRAQ
jgi:hypothetical protein